MADLMDKLTIDDLPGEQRDIAEIIGIENYKRLVEYVNGDDIYIHKKDELIRHIRNNEISKKFNGSNYRELAMEYKLTTQTIRRILNEAIGRKVKNSLHQYSLFDEAE